MRLEGSSMRVEPVSHGKATDELLKSRAETPARKPAKQQSQQYREQDANSLEKELIAAIEQANRTLQINNNKFNFSIHESTKEIIVRIIDAETEEVVKEIPPEEILDLIAKLWEMAGIVVDERR